MMVVLQHFSVTAQTHTAVTIPSLVPHGYLAVDLFFVLSGFIMGYRYGSAFDAHGLGAMPSFLRKRAARILPLNSAIVLTLTAVVLMGVTLPSESPGVGAAAVLRDGICNLLLLPGLGIGRNLNGPSWSISTEWVAYGLFPLLWLLTARASDASSQASVDRGRQWILPTLTALVCSAVVVVLTLDGLREWFDPSLIQMQLAFCLAEFTIGLLVFRALRSASVRRVMAADGIALAIGGAILLSMLLRMDLPARALFPLIVAALACNHGRVGAFLSRGPWYGLGEISFSIYLIHDPLRPVWSGFLRSLHPAPLGPVAALACAALAALAVIPLAWVVFVLIERPGRRLLRGRAPSTADAEPVVRRG